MKNNLIVYVAKNVRIAPQWLNLFIEELKVHRDNAPEEYRDELVISFDFDERQGESYSIDYFRDKTEKEMKNRRC